MKNRDLLQIVPIVFILCLAFFLFRGAFNIYFFQDDFFFFLITRVNNWIDVARFFIPRSDVQFYRPLSSEIYYCFANLLFGNQPLGYHLVGFIFYVLTIILVFQIGRQLLRNKITIYLFTLFWATSVIHYDSLYWIANFSYLLITFIYLSAFYLFLKDSLGSILQVIFIFFLGLLTNEFILGLPVTLFIYSILFKKNNKKNSWFFPVMFSLLILYLIVRFLIFPSDNHLYPYYFDKSVISSLRWFMLYFFGFPEAVKHYMINFYSFSGQFLDRFYKEVLVMMVNSLVFVLIFAFFPLISYFRNKSSLNIKYLLFSVIWILVNLFPIIFIPSQISPHRGTISFFGFLLFFFLLSDQWIGNDNFGFKKYLVIFSVLLWLVNSYLVIRFNDKTHWVKGRADLSLIWKDKIKSHYPGFPKGAKVNIITDDPEVKYALGEGRALKYIYNDNSLNVIFSSQSAEQYVTIRLD